MDVCTIYLLRNRVNGKVYVGQTWDTLKERWENGKGYKNSTYLERAIRKHGVEVFFYEVLALASDQNTADYLEDYYITRFNSRDHEKGYNIRGAGSRGLHSSETKAKLSSLTKKMWSEPGRIEKASEEKLGSKNPNYGRKLSDQEKQRLIDANSLQLDVIDEINRLYDEGLSFNRIRLLLGVSMSTVRKYVRSPREYFFSQQEINQMIDLYNSGVSINKLSKMFNTGRSVIRKHVKK